MKNSICVVHGRFQPLHNGHVKQLVLPAFEYGERVIIGITNPERDLTSFDETNPHRSEESSNPFSFWERLEMFRVFFESKGISRARYDIIPFPINFPKKISNYAPTDALYLLTIYDDWGWKKKKVLEEQGLQVKVLREMTLDEKGEGGVAIRKLMATGDDTWKQKVPGAVVSYIESNGLLAKIK